MKLRILHTRLKLALGLSYPLLAMAALCLLILTLSRLGLSVWQWPRVAAVDGFGTIMLSGLRVDLSALGYLFILPALLTPILAMDNRAGRIFLWLLRVWLLLGLWLVVYMEIATVPYILEYDVRPNRLFVEYLIYPKEVFGMLLSGYKLELFIGATVSLFTLFFGWRLTGYLVSGLSYPRWYFRPVLALCLAFLCFAGARSTTGHRPLNPAMVAFTTDPLVNDLTLNSSYSMLFAVSQMKSERNAFDYYDKMPKADIIAKVRESMNVDSDSFNDNDAPTVAYHPASYTGKPKNLVILLQESLGARYVGALGGMPLTPNLDKLINEGWSFERLYATGTRSVRGIEAVTTGFSPTPARSVVKLGKSQRNFFSLASLLKNKGYHTQFVYGGESHFDNMKSFFLGNGFVDMQDFPTFKKTNFVGSWGASDEDLYIKADQQFTELSKQQKPFFSLVFTSSNHSPYDFPENRIIPYNEPLQTRENAAKYSDYALGEFFKKARKSDYWDDTIFIVVADHDSRAWGDELVPIDHFRIPGVIIGDGVPVLRDTRLVSQLDLAPTLLSLIGISAKTPMIGHDLTKPIKTEKLRAMMQFYNHFAWMDNNHDVVIFQPEKPPVSFNYDPETTNMQAKPVSQEMIKMANANALWGSLAYEEGYYRQSSAERLLREE